MPGDLFNEAILEPALSARPARTLVARRMQLARLAGRRWISAPAEGRVGREPVEKRGVLVLLIKLLCGEVLDVGECEELVAVFGRATHLFELL